MARVMVGVRLAEAGIDAIDKIGVETDAARAVVIRVLLGEALRNKAVRDAAIEKLMAMRETI